MLVPLPGARIRDFSGIKLYPFDGRFSFETSACRDPDQPFMPGAIVSIAIFSKKHIHTGV